MMKYFSAFTGVGGFDIEGKYFEIAQQRIENKVAKGDISMFEEDE